jgi:hypothetical protein
LSILSCGMKVWRIYNYLKNISSTSTFWAEATNFPRRRAFAQNSKLCLYFSRGCISFTSQLSVIVSIYTRKNAQVVTNLQRTCSNAVPTTCQQDVFALLVPSLLTSCQRLVDNLLQGCWAQQTCYKLFQQLVIVLLFNNLSTSCEWQPCSNYLIYYIHDKITAIWLVKRSAIISLIALSRSGKSKQQNPIWRQNLDKYF